VIPRDRLDGCGCFAQMRFGNFRLSFRMGKCDPTRRITGLRLGGGLVFYATHVMSSIERMTLHWVLVRNHAGVPSSSTSVSMTYRLRWFDHGSSCYARSNRRSEWEPGLLHAPIGARSESSKNCHCQQQKYEHYQCRLEKTR
jgi:hypothetical protein